MAVTPSFANVPLARRNLGAPMDVKWMRLSRRADDPGQTFGYVDRGLLMVLLNREDYWQCAFVIPKGSTDEIRQRGLPAFREQIASLVPFLRDRVDELRDWKDISLLTVVRRPPNPMVPPRTPLHWRCRPAMSPIGGVGINLAIQDAVAAANILGPAFLRGTPTQHDLDAVPKAPHVPHPRHPAPSNSSSKTT